MGLLSSTFANFINRRKRAWRRMEAVFCKAYHKNSWRSSESASGTGSELSQTRVLIERLPAILKQLEIQSMLDLPCGDFHWMKWVDLAGVAYMGGDIVEPLVLHNRKSYSSPNRTFLQLNLIMDDLPKVDMIFTRDCLVHLSYEDIRSALRNVCRSNARYLATTTFTSRTENSDIPTGSWRPLNLEKPPFHFPPPLLVINEECTEAKGSFPDKSLGIWTIDNIRTLISGLR